jgi:hypothetical protein
MRAACKMSFHRWDESLFHVLYVFVFTIPQAREDFRSPCATLRDTFFEKFAIRADSLQGYVTEAHFREYLSSLVKKKTFMIDLGILST